MVDMLRYIEEIVEPTISDFERHPTSRRHAFLACVATFHAIDYLAWPTERPATLRQTFRQQSSDFRIVDQVAHAFKHFATGPRNNPNLSHSQVVPRPPAVAGVMMSGLSCVGDAVGGVVIPGNDGDYSVDLLSTVRRAVTFLRENFQSATEIDAT